MSRAHLFKYFFVNISVSLFSEMSISSEIDGAVPIPTENFSQPPSLGGGGGGGTGLI